MKRVSRFLDALTHSGPGYDTGAAPGAAQQDQVAYRIRAELVCCDIYERIRREAFEIDKSRESVDPTQAPPTDPTDFGMQGAVGRAIIRKDWHDQCYYGEAAARIAEGRCPGYETDPNVCRCGCEGCKHNCSVHIEWTPEVSDG